ncbi:MAG: type II 3-dehydroquinate dehydratase [Coriobacteriaceae bacterium]|jgi:3-dehydroquinate dehydratase-2|nr:type II 3-dehydroquinate dehydratase [Olsenella sp.]MCI1289172.1 type II 3-dehydroquinate dehydratase [Olsenella sp.]RRF91015.1 MAG: type II 3-dehydroquinate dehydratase [Coriobacteriaceae bacterium]
METGEAARAVLKNIGGKANVASNGLCMTRLRITVKNPTLINRTALKGVPGVLGVASFGTNGIEVVFGPRVVQRVFDSFASLTGLEPDIELPPLARGEGSGIHVQITPPDKAPAATPLAADASQEPDEFMLKTLLSLDDDDDDEEDDSFMDDDTLDDDDELEEPDAGEKDEAPSPSDGPRLLVINGPNINMLGIREPDLYGRQDYAELIRVCREAADAAGFSSCECYQSNHEGDIVDRIQAAYQKIDGIVINPGAYTHTSVAILDALKAVSIPAVEVHISKVDEREDFRQVSFVRLACFETIIGEGIQGYVHAIRDLAEHLGA